MPFFKADRHPHLPDSKRTTHYETWCVVRSTLKAKNSFMATGGRVAVVLLNPI